MAKLLFIPIAGLGASQFRTITTGFLWWRKVAPGLIDAIKAIPDVLVFDNSGWDEFRGDGIWDFLNDHPGLPVYLAGHSLGADTALHAAGALGARCRGLLLAAPVWRDKPTPRCPTLVFKPETSVFPQANVGDVPAMTIPGTDHNSLVHHVVFLSSAVDAVKAILEALP